MKPWSVDYGVVQKKHILDEIQRTATANGGTPLGVARFQRETGIKATDWHGKYWSRWGDALMEAGFSPNALQGAYPDETLFDKLADLSRELGRFPVTGELKLKRRTDPTFPSAKVFDRLGLRHQVAARLAEHCRTRGDMDDVVAMCAERTAAPTESEGQAEGETTIGFVYLFKSGRYYKIGKSNAAGRREREVALQLPEKTTAIHTIRTDDPSGIETYWHSRFAQKRLNGEWFDLLAADIRAFRRRIFM